MKLHFQLFAITVMMIFSQNYSYSYMFWNQAANFPGLQNNYLVIPNSSSININGSITLGLWLFPVNSILPANQILLEKTFPNGNGFLIYLKNGKAVLRTNGNDILEGNSIIQSGTWTNLTITYNTITDSAFIFLNGLSDASSKIIGAEPIANSDSLRIGISRYNPSLFPFQGFMDEIGISNRAFTKFKIKGSYRISSQYENDWKLYISFQNKNAQGILFNLTDWSGNNNTILNNGITAIDLSNQPSNNIIHNGAVYFNGSGYLSGVNNPDINPTTGITVEAWVKSTDSLVTSQYLLHKGQPSGKAAYGLRIINNFYTAVINGTEYTFNSEYDDNISSDNNIPNKNSLLALLGKKFNYMAFTYNSFNGIISYYCDGEKMNNDTAFIGTINTNSDSLYVGGTSSGNNFYGYMDNIRISNYVKSPLEIANSKFISIDKSNEPNPIMKNVSYNFDGSFNDNCDNGPLLKIRGMQNNETIISYTESSPVLRADSEMLSKGFYLSNSSKKIPEAGIMGITLDTLEMYHENTIFDIDVFVNVRHENIQELKLSLISPTGSEIILAENETVISDGANSAFTTVFDDESNYSLSTGYASFGPLMLPRNGLVSTLAGQNTLGKWKLKIVDQSGQSTGELYGWGLRINNSTQRLCQLDLKYYLQGLYNSSLNSMIGDTVTVQLRSAYYPYYPISSVKKKINSNGKGFFTFPVSVIEGDYYYLVVKHRNSIETWSSETVDFDYYSADLIFDGSSDPSNTYGNNVTQVDAAPIRFAIYAADVNQDGTIDLTDGSQIDNDAINFATGYLITDINGDEVVDVSDAVFADNNAFNFITKITP